ncbi:MAG: ArsI/CadI family heavy metal resistance metalloenzyme [Bacteroidota bacterium]
MSDTPTTPVVFPRMHVSLYVQNIGRTVSFYDRFFNQPAAKVMPGYAKYELASPGLIISFVENAERAGESFGHLGIQVGTAQQLNTELAKATGLGLHPEIERGTNCCYARQDKFWVTDPDGYKWEVYHFHEDVAFNDPHYTTGESEQCCAPEMVTAEPAIVEESKAETSCTPGGGCC